MPASGQDAGSEREVDPISTQLEDPQTSLPGISPMTKRCGKLPNLLLSCLRVVAPASSKNRATILAWFLPSFSLAPTSMPAHACCHPACPVNYLVCLFPEYRLDPSTIPSLTQSECHHLPPGSGACTSLLVPRCLSSGLSFDRPKSSPTSNHHSCTWGKTLPHFLGL